MVVVDRFTGEVRAMVGGADPQFAGYNRALQARRSIGSLAKPATYLTALSQPNTYRLNSWIADEPIALKQPNGSIWKPMNDDRRFSGKVMLVDALTNSMNVPTVNLGMTLGLNAVVDTWTKLGVPKDQLNPVPAMLLGALNLTPVEVAQAFQSIASGGNHAELSAVRSVIAEDGTVLYQSFPQAQRVEPAQAAYLTLYTMQQVVDRGTARALGARFPNAHLAGKPAPRTIWSTAGLPGLMVKKWRSPGLAVITTSRPNSMVPAGRCRFTAATWTIRLRCRCSLRRRKM